VIVKILIWFYIIFVVPPLVIIMAGLAYGGVVETVKIIKHEKKN